MNIKEQRNLFIKRYNVSCETIKKLDLFYEKILHYQKEFNLIGRGTLNKVWIRHFLDSAGAIDIIKKEIRDYVFQNKRVEILDIGSGAGFPGIVLGLLLKDCGNISLSLVEASKKKCYFLNEVINCVDSNIEVINCRVENLHNKKFNFITARAVSKLDNLFKMSEKLIHKNVTLIFFKGRSWTSELLLIKKKWKFENIIVKNKNDIENTGGVLMVFKKIKKIS